MARGSVLLAFLAVLLTPASTNLLQNPDFEESFENNWFCNAQRCLFARSNDSFTGQHSAHVFSRASNGQGLEQRVDGIVGGKMYILSARTKILSSANQYDSLLMAVTFVGGRSRRETVSIQPYIRPCDGWVQLTTDVTAKSDTYSFVVSVAVKSVDTEFLVDDASLVELIADPDWKIHANERIASLRMGTLTINVNMGPVYRNKDVILMVNQTKSFFPFGAAVNAHSITGTSEVQRRYQDYYYSMYNWATIKNKAKWRFTESEENQPTFDLVRSTLDTLDANGIQGVRGHSVSWGKLSKVLKWVQNLDAQGIKEAVTRRLLYLAEEFGNRFVHWDMNNEQLHGSWYEDSTNNTDFTPAMHVEMHKLLPDAKLFLNDYAVVANRVTTSAYKRQVASFVERGIPLNGVGVQAHISIFPNVDEHKYRLDQLAMSGVPIWITELDIRETNVTVKAQLYDDMIRLYYSHPAITGIIMWSFWEDDSNPTTGLVEGDEFVENEAGRQVRRLVHEEWRSHVSVPLNSRRTQTHKLRAFHGQYNLTIWNDGRTIYDTTFDLEKHEEVVINIELD